jgi:hypothetical protein
MPPLLRHYYDIAGAAITPLITPLLFSPLLLNNTPLAIAIIIIGH